MRYFDNQYLAQYLQQGRELMVFVDSEYLEVVDVSDLADPVEGVGYDASGRMNTFNYKDIEVIKSGPYYVDLATLTNQLDNYENPEAASAAKPPVKGEKPAADTPEKDAAPEDTPTPDEEDPLAEHKFMRRSHSLNEKVDYWSMINKKKEISMVTNSLTKIKEGPYQGLVGLIVESQGGNSTVRATNKGSDWTWGETVIVPDSQLEAR